MTLWLPGEAGIRAIDDVLWILGVPTSLSKAEGTPLTRRGFEAIVRALVAQMVEPTTPITRGVRTRYAQLLDRRWREMTAEDRERAVLDLAGRMRSDLVSTVHAISAAVERSTRGTINATVQATALKHRLDVPTVFSARDAVYADHARRSNAVYMRDRFGRIVNGPVAQGVRDAIARGVDDGVDNRTIAEDIARVAQTTLAERTQAYYVMVAATATARARTYGELTSFQRAGIKRYTVQSVRDESTCDTCNFMHGRSFDVADAVERFDRAARSDPEELPDIHPFVSSRRIGTALYIGARKRNTWEPIAEVERSARGTKDQPGSFRTILDDARIQGLGAGCCPFHPHCRCVLFPDFSPSARRTGPAAARRVPAPVAPPAAPTMPAPVFVAPAPQRAPTVISFIPPAAPPPVAPAAPGPFEIRTLGARPIIGPPPAVLPIGTDPRKAWGVRGSRATVDTGARVATTLDAASVERVFGGGRVPTLEALSKAWADGDHWFDFQDIYVNADHVADNVSFRGYIRDAAGKLVSDGLVVRTFEREAGGKLIAHHDLMVLKPKATPDGFATRVVRNACATYTHLGVDAVEVHAAWSGKFAWPSMGFDWIDPAAQRAKFTEEMRNRLPALGMRIARDEAEALAAHPWHITDLDDGQTFKETDSFGRSLKMRLGQKFMYDQKGLVYLRLNLADASSASFVRARRKLFGE